MVAEGPITFDELGAKLAALDETRATAQYELEGLKRRREHLESLEQDKEALLENYAARPWRPSTHSHPSSDTPL